MASSVIAFFNISISSLASCEVRILLNTFAPSSIFPLLISQRGDSGIFIIPNPSTIAGITAKDNIYLHTWPESPIEIAIIALKTNANNCPETIINSFLVTTLPLFLVGEISAKYVGTVTDTPPTAIPKANLPANMKFTLGDNTQQRLAMKKSIDKIIIVFFLPYISVTCPIPSAPIVAPSCKIATTKPCWNEFKLS